MQADKISFGTNPKIDYIGARAALPKYRQDLTKGIFTTFKKLTKNNLDDSLYLNVATSWDTNGAITDLLQLSYWVKDEKSPIGISLQSVSNLDLKNIETFSPRKIKKILFNEYEKLKNSETKTDLSVGYSSYAMNNYPQKHIKLIKDLTDKFGCFFDLANYKG